MVGHEDPVYQWEVWGDTYPPHTEYSINTYVAGYDRCNNTDPWTYEMSGSNTVYNANYGTSGNWAVGNYISSCGGNHS